eukprot:104813_1
MVHIVDPKIIPRHITPFGIGLGAFNIIKTCIMMSFLLKLNQYIGILFSRNNVGIIWSAIVIVATANNALIFSASDTIILTYDATLSTVIGGIVLHASDGCFLSAERGIISSVVDGIISNSNDEFFFNLFQAQTMELLQELMLFVYEVLVKLFQERKIELF